MNVQDMFSGIKGEGAKRSSLIRALDEDGYAYDIVMVEADDIDGTVYLKLEVIA